MSPTFSSSSKSIFLNLMSWYSMSYNPLTDTLAKASPSCPTWVPPASTPAYIHFKEGFKEKSHHSTTESISWSGWFPTMWSINFSFAAGLETREKRDHVMFTGQSSSLPRFPICDLQTSHNSFSMGCGGFPPPHSFFSTELSFLAHIWNCFHPTHFCP